MNKNMKKRIHLVNRDTYPSRGICSRRCYPRQPRLLPSSSDPTSAANYKALSQMSGELATRVCLQIILRSFRDELLSIRRGARSIKRNRPKIFRNESQLLTAILTRVTAVTLVRWYHGIQLRDSILSGGHGIPVPRKRYFL